MRSGWKATLTIALLGLTAPALLAQSMPTPTLIVNTRCSVAHGYSMDDVLEVARSMSFDGSDAPRWIGYRVPVAGNGEMEPNQVVRAVRWENLAHWERFPSYNAHSELPSRHKHLVHHRRDVEVRLDRGTSRPLPGS